MNMSSLHMWFTNIFLQSVASLYFLNSIFKRIDFKTFYIAQFINLKFYFAAFVFRDMFYAAGNRERDFEEF